MNYFLGILFDGFIPCLSEVKVTERPNEKSLKLLWFSIILNRTPELRAHLMRASCHGNKKITTSDLACVVRFKNLFLLT